MEKEVLLNEFQTSIEDLQLDKLHPEIQELFWDFFYNVPLIQHMVSPDRKRAKDLPKDVNGKIIVDVTHPHILEDMDYFRQSAIHYLKYGCYTKLRPNGNPNSEFGRWLIEEVRRCREGYVRESDGEWITGDYYYFLNYAPMLLVKKKDKKDKKGQRVFDFPTVWEGHYLKFHALNQAREHGHHYAELASRSKGKAHPYSQIVYTPEGVKLWGNIKIGDKLFGDDGKVTTVIDIPFDEETKIYKVTLSDGRTLECSLGHLFNVRDCRKKAGEQLKTLSLEEIMNSDYYHLRKDGKYESYFSIPNNKGVDFNSKEVLIDPYTLGLALGDGCFRTRYSNVLMFTSRDEDIKTYEKYVPYSMYKLESGKFDYRISIPHIKDYLIHYGLDNTGSSDKFIPDDYLFNTREVRLNVLRGLLDTDGTVNNNGIPMLTTTSERLCNDVILLCRSLGYNTRMFKKLGKYYDKKCKMTYNISILTNDPVFRLDRKLQLLTKFESAYSKSRRDWTHIVSIEYSHNEKAKCVTVDNKSHCYLIGEFITTHNSYTAAAMLAKRFVMGESKEVNKKVTCYITADDRKYLVAGDQTLDKFLYNIDWMSNNMELPSMRLINSLSNMLWIMGYKDSDSGTNKGTLNSVIGVTSKDDPAKLRGSRGVLYVIEEFGTFPALKNLWGNLLPSVEEGEDVFGLIMAYGCCCAGTKVFDANNNLINIEDVSNSILGYDGTNTSVEDVTYLQPEAYKDCVEIVTTNGSIKCSTDHPLLALNKNIFGRSKGTCSFYRTNELKKGDTLLMHGNDRFGNINVSDAYLLGALYGDGNYSGNSCVSLSITTEEEYEYYNSNYNIGISKLRNTENGGLYAQIYFRNTHPLLKKYGMDKQSGADKKFPKNIWQWDKESIAQFLAGYFDADGNVLIVKDKHRSIKLSCKYREPLEQVTYLLQKFGIYSYILLESKPLRVLKSTVNNASSTVPENIGYVLYICNGDDIVTFRENIPIKIQYKKNRLDSYILLKGKSRYKSLGFVYREENKKGYNFIGTQFEDLKGTKIIDIKYLGRLRIYNLTANTTHTYLSNGFISSNTAGDNDSDFGSAQELVYNPTGYHIEAFENVYDKIGLGKRQFAYFFPGYINLANCYNSNGVSDVTKAVLTILKDRFNVKYHTTDINAITKRIAEIPITPQEAMLKTRGNMFPVTLLNDRINTIDNDPTFYDNVYVGTLVQKTSGEVEFQPSFDIPIRDFPLKDNNAPGALEIYEMPLKNSEGKVFPGRYIAGHDPVDADDAETLSLTSSFILDLYTDRIVAEFTGRKEYADDNFEMLRLMCLFYNAKCCYENNKRGVFAYFSLRRCLHLLADTPEYLIDKQLIKFRGYGNSSKGIAATKPINDYANRLIREWLIKPVTITVEEDGEVVLKTVPNLSFVKNRALLKELICFNPLINVDRVRALGMAMLYRGEFVDRFEGDLSRVTNLQLNIKEDDYFSHYDTMIANFEKH